MHLQVSLRPQTLGSTASWISGPKKQMAMAQQGVLYLQELPRKLTWNLRMGPVEKGQLFSKAPFLRFQFHLSFQKCISLGSPIVSTKIKPLSLHLGGKSSLIGFPWASRHLCWHCNAWILGLMRIFDGSKFLGILQGCCRLFTLPETNTVRPWPPEKEISFGNHHL